jgi:hypothetical protein
MNRATIAQAFSFTVARRFKLALFLQAPEHVQGEETVVPHRPLSV